MLTHDRSVRAERAAGDAPTPGVSLDSTVPSPLHCGTASACAPHERCSSGLQPCVCHVDTRRAVLLLNLGTPDSPEVADVRRYLAEFLADPWVIRLPRALRWFNPVLSRIIALARGRKSARAYRTVWTDEGSPLAVITARQAAGLGQRLPRGWQVFYAMRYGNPSIRAVLDRIASERITDLVVVPMYPQWSGPTTGTALEAFYGELRRLTDQRRGLRLNVSVRAEWYDDAGYVDATARQVHRAALAHGLNPENSVLLISAHSLPQKYVADGDPYEGHVRRTLELVRERLGWPQERVRIGFQSKLGPVPWLSPSTGAVLAELAQAGEQNVLCLPLSFTADCLETLEEIGVEYAEEFARASGGGRLVRVDANNDDPGFLDALVGLVRRGAHRVAPGTRPTPLFAPRAARLPIEALARRLAVVGFATQRRLETPRELDVTATPEPVFHAVKRPQLEAAELVARVAARADVEEAWLYNTCQRYELYALAREGVDPAVVAEGLREALAGEHAAHAQVRVGQHGYWHLLRTASGLNSRLPGDTDVLEQLASARRMAEGAGAAGAGAARLIDETGRQVRALRGETPWGGFATDYCRAALAPLLGDLGLDHARVALVGGSTTTVSLVELLAKDCAVADERVTVVYRSATQRRLAKVLAALAKGAKRMVVDEYDQPDVLAAIAGVDVLFLGVDREQPVLRRGHIEGLRDFAARPLVIVDFNVHGSTEGLAEVKGVRVVSAAELSSCVDRHADQVIAAPAFAAAQRAVEAQLRAAALGPSAALERAAEAAPASASAPLREASKPRPEPKPDTSCVQGGIA
ncbi:MAG: ferrochelatase [Planctomycetota bacterium]